MSVTVNDCLKLPSLRSGEVIAGKNGLSKVVNSVSVLEVIDSEMFNSDSSVDNGDICVTSLFSIKDDVDMQCKTIEYLNNMGDSCIVLYYIGIYLETVDQRLIDTADRLDFPIIMMPKNRLDFRYSEVISEISDIIRRDKNNSNNFIDKITSLVSHLPENKKTLNNLMRIMSDNLKCSLLLCDSNQVHMSYSPWPISNNLEPADIINLYEKESEQGEILLTTTWNDSPIQIYKVPFSNIEYNNYSLFGIDSLGFLKLEDLYQVTELLAIFSRLWDIDGEDILSGALIPTIMDGDDKNMRLISSKLSLNINEINTSMIINLPNISDNDYTVQYKIKGDIIKAIKNYSEEMKKKIIIDTYSIYILAFIHSSISDDYDIEYISGVQKEIESITSSYSLSVFNIDDNIIDVRKTYQLYLDEINNLHILFPNKKLFSYGDLLFAKKCRETIDSENEDYRICNNIIKPLEELNDKDDLLQTLSIYYLDSDCKINKTSELLFLHRNTIQYRLNKIKEITNYSPQSTFDVSILQLATGCYRLMQKDS